MRYFCVLYGKAFLSVTLLGQSCCAGMVGIQVQMLAIARGLQYPALSTVYSGCSVVLSCNFFICPLQDYGLVCEASCATIMTTGMQMHNPNDISLSS